MEQDKRYLVVVKDMGYEAEILGGLTRQDAHSLALSITQLLLDYKVTKPVCRVVEYEEA